MRLRRWVLTCETVWYHCAVLARSLLRSAAIAVVAVVLSAAPALAQTPTVSPAATNTIAKAPAPWTFYMAIVTVGIAGLTLLMAVAGYMVQSPGFRKVTKSGAAGGGSGSAAS